PIHQLALVNHFLQRISALSVSAFVGAEVSGELAQTMREATSRADAATRQVLAPRLRERVEAAEREGQALVRDTFAKAVTLAK
uniref:hypothetical protein n=1 Tax=Cupriavidus plantarum TaxID=942865 RepID=UPI00339D5C31